MSATDGPPTGLNHAANAGMHSYADRGHDHYATPQLAARKLLERETLRGGVMDPFAGTGGIVGVLRQAGYRVAASDLIDWGCPDCVTGVDFFTVKTAAPGVETAVFNPPFKDAARAVRHALTLVPLVISLQRLAFLESEARNDLIDSGPLARVHVFRKRLPMMHRGNWTGPKASSSVAFSWFVFLRGYCGPVLLDRI
jgi:hypothetical protein